MVAIFDTWWAVPEVLEHIDDKAGRKADGSLHFSRQRVTGWLTMHSGSRAGDSLDKLMVGRKPWKPALRRVQNARCVVTNVGDCGFRPRQGISTLP